MFTVTNVLLLADVGEVCCGVTTGLVGAVGDVCVNITTFGAKGTSFEEFKSDPTKITESSTHEFVNLQHVYLIKYN